MVILHIIDLLDSSCEIRGDYQKTPRSDSYALKSFNASYKGRYCHKQLFNWIAHRSETTYNNNETITLIHRTISKHIPMKIEPMKAGYQSPRKNKSLHASHKDKPKTPENTSDIIFKVQRSGPIQRPELAMRRVSGSGYGWASPQRWVRCGLLRRPCR